MIIPGTAPDPWPLWFTAATQPDIDRAIVSLYTDLDAAVAARGPTCWLSGKCCHFESYGHRLYVTGLEIAWVLTQVSLPASPPVSSDGCVFQCNNLCSIHTVRPLGCRIFFCQQGTQDWQHELYEQFLTRLRQLHDAHDLPYRYMEWRAGLADASHCMQLPSSADVAIDGRTP